MWTSASSLVCLEMEKGFSPKAYDLFLPEFGMFFYE